MDWKKPGAKLITVLFSLCLLFDVFGVYGDTIAPSAVAQSMCALRWLDLIGRFVFLGGWAEYVDGKCSGVPDDASAAIIGFLLKVSVVSLGIVGAVLLLPLREKPEGTTGPGPLLATEDAERKKVTWWKVFLLFIFPAMIVWRHFANSSPAEFRNSLDWKLSEDVFLFLYFGGWILSWLAFVDLLMLPILRRCFPRENWLRTR
jgi:hypothetical protein